MDDGAIEPTLTAADPAGSEVPAFGACPASRPEARKPAREQAAHPTYPAISQHPRCATPATRAAASGDLRHACRVGCGRIGRGQRLVV